MYMPYLRGKQFELIAIREMIDTLADKSDKISPIIEPVKSSSTLKTTLELLRNHNINFSIIVNPEVGDFISNPSSIIELLNDLLGGYENYQPAIIVNDQADFNKSLTALAHFTLSANCLSLIHNTDLEKIEKVIDRIEHNYKPVCNNIVNFSKTGRHYYRKFARGTRVSLDDYFKSKDRNKDYLQIEQSYYTDEHLSYKEEGFKGFSDFLTIGDTYSETGALPYAVAIHISYSDSENKIRVRHFVSDSNEDKSDVAGKFSEALRKLVTWADRYNIQTQAINVFRVLYKSGHFPGLGSIKKLSIMNHLEVVLNLI